MENLWQAVIAFQDYPFKTATGLPFRYKLKVGKNGEYNRGTRYLPLTFRVEFSNI